MSKIRNLAQAIRHTPGIENAEWLWHLLRQPYHRFLNLSGKGVSIPVGGSCFVRIPPEFSGAHWELYEPESIKAIVNWLKEHPTALFLDIGCAIGIFSTVALFASEQVEVFAFDSDLSSLKATERMCQYAVGNRLELIYGFISDKHVSELPLRTITAKTWEAITASSATGDPGTNTYVCLYGNTDNTIPTHSLDGLILTESFMNRSILLKCDVEGAELLVPCGVNTHTIFKPSQQSIFRSF